jgi:endonuclease/exonuclease/phosphatase family metal-dependent hydrolase
VYALQRRAAEAAAVRTYVTGVLAGAGKTHRLVVAGDLNDEPEAATTQILLGPPGSEFNTGGYGVDDKGDGQRLWNLGSRIEPPSERFTRRYRGRGELIDHLLVSHAMDTRLQEVRTVGPPPSSVTDNPGARREDPASDHRPVAATFRP